MQYINGKCNYPFVCVLCTFLMWDFSTVSAISLPAYDSRDLLSLSHFVSFIFTLPPFVLALLLFLYAIFTVYSLRSEPPFALSFPLSLGHLSMFSIVSLPTFALSPPLSVPPSLSFPLFLASVPACVLSPPLSLHLLLVYLFILSVPFFYSISSTVSVPFPLFLHCLFVIISSFSSTVSVPSLALYPPLSLHLLLFLFHCLYAIFCSFSYSVFCAICCSISSTVSVPSLLYLLHSSMPSFTLLSSLSP